MKGGKWRKTWGRNAKLCLEKSRVNNIAGT